MKAFTISEIVSILLILLGLLLLSDLLFGTWAGQAKYILTELTLLTFVIAFIKLRGLSISTLLRWNPVQVKCWKYLILLALASTFLLNEFDKLIIIITSTPPEFLTALEKSYQFNSVSDLLWLMIGIGIAASCVEESIFRGMVQTTLESKYSFVVAIVITSILFALVHLKPYWFPQLTLLSLIAGYSTWKMNSIVPGVLIHGANNIWSLLKINGFAQEFGTEINWDSNFYFGTITIAIIGVIYSLINLKQN